MRTKVTMRRPRNWKAVKGHGKMIRHAADVTIAGSRLSLKVLVFRSNPDLSRFWDRALGLGRLPRNTLGAVNKLSTTVYASPDYARPVRREVDGRYYAVMGLVAGKGTTHEVVVHESVHAAFAFAERLGARNPYINPDQDEEAVCYPAGKIACEVTRWLHEVGEFTWGRPAKAA